MFFAYGMICSVKARTRGGKKASADMVLLLFDFAYQIIAEAQAHANAGVVQW